MGEADGQRAVLERRARRQELAVDGEAALSVEGLARGQIPLRGRHRVAGEVPGRAGRPAEQGGGQDRHVELQPDEVKRLVHRRVPAARIGVHPVLAKARRAVVVGGLDDDVHPPAQVVRDWAPVALDRGHHLDLAPVMELATVRRRAEHVREVVAAARREPESVRRRGEPGGVRDRRHLDRGLGPVEERVEHPAVHARGPRLLGGESVVLPHRVGRRAVVGGQVLRALARRHHLEAAHARPLHHLAGEGGLVAVGHGVDDAGVAGFRRQQRPGQHVGLDVHHHDVLAARECGAGVGDAGRGVARRFHHDVHVGGARRVQRIVGESRAGEEGVAPADGAAGGAGAVRIEVRDHAHFESGRRGRLAQEHRAELAGADEPDPHRPCRRGALAKLLVDVHGVLRPPLRGGWAPRDSRRRAARWGGSRGARPIRGA